MKSRVLFSVLAVSLSTLISFAACDSKKPAENPSADAKAEAGKAADEAKDNAQADADKKDAAKDAKPAAAPAEDNNPVDPAPADDAKPKKGGSAEAAVPAEVPPPAPTGESVVCEEAEGCDCGETKCPMNATCTDGVCKCGNTLVESYYTGYACFEIARGVYDLGCTESEGCPCGKIKVYSNMGCSGSFGTCAGSPVPGRGLSCRHKPYKNKFYSLGCFKDECDCFGETIHKDEVCPPLDCENGFKPTPQGCTCDGMKYVPDYACVPGKEQRLVSFCFAPDGCQCGEDGHCPQETVCRKGKCVDRYTLHELPEGFEIEYGLPTCRNEETCICSNKKGKTKTCKVGQVCLNNYCYNNPNFRKFGDTAYYYNLGKFDPIEYEKIWNLMFVDETLPICSIFPKIREASSDNNICDGDQTKTVADVMTHCGTAPIPDDVKVLFCDINFDLNDEVLKFSGWHK